MEIHQILQIKGESMRGQIVKIVSNNYTVEANHTNYVCKARGRFRKEKKTPLVGDYVLFDEKNNYILEIEKRKNALVRPMVANIDQAFLVTSLKEPDLSLNLLDKLLVVMEVNKIKPIICLTKQDKCNKEEWENDQKIMHYYKNLGYVVLLNTELAQIKDFIRGKTSVFTGQTGAGKSTLLNHLDTTLHLQTGEISMALNRGRHTTRHVELLEMYGGKVLDTPGFSSLEFKNMTQEEIKNAFVEFKRYPCIYKDCNHIDEKECKVKEAVRKNQILASRYENYKKIVGR